MSSDTERARRTSTPEDQGPRASISLLALVERGNVAEAISIIKAMPNAIEASRAFIELAKQTYRELHDVSAMIAIGDAGTQFVLLKAASPGNSAVSDDLKKLARILAFNTAANCWPGWGDAGVDIRKDHLNAGRRLALLCRDLTEELNLGHKQRGTSLWLVGALDLAMDGYADALAGFRRAKLEFEAAGDADLVLMAEGYAALTLKAQPESRLTGARELAHALALLRERGTQEAKFFADQLSTADRVLIYA